MAEIESVPSNGLVVVSTFSGCGGSCLGFRMAGFKSIWASEFIPAARAVYEANNPGVPVDGRDIRLVGAEDILQAANKKKGEIDVLEGSPPCASFSTAGKRESAWGKVKQYSDSRQRTDDLFFEYVRILRGLMPRAFVAENVSGLVKGTAKGYFKIILRELRASGYRVEARLLDAQWLGVPQARQRLIFVGARDDLGVDPAFPSPLNYRYSVREAIGGHVVGIEGATGFNGHATAPATAPATAILASRPVSGDFIARQDESGDIGRFAIGKEWDRMKPGEQSDRYFNLVKPSLSSPCPTITALGGCPNIASVVHPTERRKFTIAELKRVCGFPDDFRLSGTYAQQWERLGRAVPPPMMRSVAEAVRDRILSIGKRR